MTPLLSLRYLMLLIDPFWARAGGFTTSDAEMSYCHIEFLEAKNVPHG